MAAADRALRRSVARLAELGRGDRDAILDLLDNDARVAVLALLSEADPELAAAAGSVPEPQPEPVDGAVVAPLGLSEWLARLVETPSSADEAGSGTITAHCLAALQACSAELAPQLQPVPKPPKPPGVTASLRQFAGRLREAAA